jgi:4-amino-4-deoxy-L-arabinose transferase-like glycosyltransferase
MHAAFGVVLLVALAARVIYVLHTSNFVPRVDGRSYDSLARGLATGHGWVTGKSAYRPPGYPFFLAGVYWLVGVPARAHRAGVGGWEAVRLCEAVLATGTVGLIGILAGQVAGRRVALASMAIAAVYLPLILVGVSLMTESLLVPLLLGATVCALRSRAAPHSRRWIAAAGFLAGLAALTRGNGIVIAPALAVIVWTGRPRFRRQSLGAPVLLLLITALTISPWTIRNAIEQHAFIPVTTELGATLAGTYNDTAAREHFLWRIGRQYPNWYALRNNHRLSELVRSSRLLNDVLSYIGQHPTYVPQAMFWNTVRLADLEGRDISRTSARADVEATAPTADLAVYIFWAVGLLAIAGLFTRSARTIPKALWLIPALIWLSEAPITTGTPRFRAALDPWIILLAATALATIAASLSRTRRPGRSPRAVATP